MLTQTRRRARSAQRGPWATVLRVAVVALAALSVFDGAATAQEREKRVALVVGNGAYARVPQLANPADDARAMSAALRSVGFQVVEAIDASRTQMFTAMVTFAETAKGADAALVFYAGHGVQVGGENWVLPIDASISTTTELRADGVRLADVTQTLDDAGARVKIVLLDACRDNPFPLARTRSAGQGLAAVNTASAAGTLVAFATAPGAVAADGDGRNSPFTKALVAEIGKPGVEIRQMLGMVRSRVYAETGERQIPWVNEALIGSFYFAGEAGPEDTLENDGQALKETGLSEKDAFEIAQDIDTAAGWNAFLEAYPSGAYQSFAEAALAKSLDSAAARPAAPAARSAEDDFLLPDSATRRLTEADLSAFDKAQLRLARNEIFARKGRFFRSKDLRAYFESKPWYRPTAWVVALNRVERRNVQLLLALEKAR